MSDEASEREEEEALTLASLNAREETEPKAVDLFRRIQKKRGCPLLVFAGLPDSYICYLDEFAVLEAYKNISQRRRKIPKMDILLNSPGGEISCAYKVAKFLRRRVGELSFIIPHIAKSGGTLMSVAADDIYLGPLGELGPLDTQIRHPQYETDVSALSAFRTWEMLEENVMQNGELSPPMSNIADKYDPVLIGEWQGALLTAEEYAKELLTMKPFKGREDKAAEIAHKLTWEYPSHGYVIDFDKAKSIGLNVIKLVKYPAIRYVLALFQYYMTQEPPYRALHFVRWCAP